MKRLLPSPELIAITVHIPRSSFATLTDMEVLEEMYVLSKLVKILEFSIANGLENRQDGLTVENRMSRRYKAIPVRFRYIANMFVYVQLLQNLHDFSSHGTIFQTFKDSFKRQVTKILEQVSAITFSIP